MPKEIEAQDQLHLTVMGKYYPHLYVQETTQYNSNRTEALDERGKHFHSDASRP